MSVKGDYTFARDDADNVRATVCHHDRDFSKRKRGKRQVFGRSSLCEVAQCAAASVTSVCRFDRLSMDFA